MNIPEDAVNAAAQIIQEVDYPEYKLDLEFARRVLAAAHPAIAAAAWDEGAEYGWMQSGEGWNSEYPGDPVDLSNNPYRA